MARAPARPPRRAGASSSAPSLPTEATTAASASSAPVAPATIVVSVASPTARSRPAWLSVILCGRNTIIGPSWRAAAEGSALTAATAARESCCSLLKPCFEVGRDLLVDPHHVGSPRRLRSQRPELPVIEFGQLAVGPGEGPLGGRMGLHAPEMPGIAPQHGTDRGGDDRHGHSPAPLGGHLGPSEALGQVVGGVEGDGGDPPGAVVLAPSQRPAGGQTHVMVGHDDGDRGERVAALGPCHSRRQRLVGGRAVGRGHQINSHDRTLERPCDIGGTARLGPRASVVRPHPRSKLMPKLPDEANSRRQFRTSVRCRRELRLGGGGLK